MKFRSTLILLCVGAALLAYVWFIERHRKTTREATDAASHVVQIDRDKINSISIKNLEAEIELKKDDKGQWALQKPLADRADSSTVTQLFTTIETLRHDAKVEVEKGKDQLKEFGVADASTKVRFTGDGVQPVEILIGKDAAVEGKVYARVANDDDTVYVIPNELKNQLSKKADDFRDRKLTDLSAQQVNRMTVKSQAGELQLERKNNHWSIVKPMNARGDDSKINDLVAQATTASISQFIADTNLATYGLTEPRATISLFAEGNDTPTVLQIGNNPKEEKDKNKVYAKLSTRDAVLVLPQEIEKILEQRPNDLRDRKLVRVDSDIVDRITIETSGKKMVLARKGESWVRKDGDKDVAINDGVASRILTDLQNTEVTNFVADTATDLPKYGLDQPPVKVTLSSFASENTAETGAGDKPIVAVLFGKVEGDNGYAKVDTEPFIVAVPKTLIESIPQDPIQLQPLAIFQSKPEEITALEIAKAGQPPVPLAREGEQWKLAKGDGNINQDNVQALVRTIAGLHAVRWAGATNPAEQGLDTPAATISFTVTQGDKTTQRKLMIGSRTSDNLFHATADGLAGTFLISQPDHDTLQAAVIDTPSQPAAGEPAAATATPAPESVPAVAPAPAPDSSTPAAGSEPAASTAEAPAGQ